MKNPCFLIEEIRKLRCYKSLLAIALASLSLNAMGVEPGTYYVDAINGNDSTGAKGDPTHPYKTIYAWDGITGDPPTGVTTLVNNGDSIAIFGPWTNYVPVLPILAPNVTVYGIGGPTIWRTNCVGTDECDNYTAGPLVQPNTGSEIYGLTIVASNGLAATGFEDAGFGLVDEAAENVAGTILATCGFTSVSIATNWYIHDCFIYGESWGVYTGSDNSYGVTNIGKIERCTIVGSNNCILTKLSSYGFSYNCIQSISSRDNTYFFPVNTNVGTAWSAIRISNRNSPSTNYFYEHASTIVITNDNAVAFVTASYYPQVFLDHTQFTLASNTVVIGGQINALVSSSINGTFFDTNNVLNSVHTIPSYY